MKTVTPPYSTHVEKKSTALSAVKKIIVCCKNNCLLRTRGTENERLKLQRWNKAKKTSINFHVYNLLHPLRNLQKICGIPNFLCEC